MSFSKAVIEMRYAKAKNRPKGWQTRDEIAAELGMSPGHTSTLLAKMISDGSAECIRWIKYDSLGKASPSRLFRVKK